MKPITVDNITLTKADIENIRERVIGFRDDSFEQWPDAIPFTMEMNAVIVILAQVIEEYPR